MTKEELEQEKTKFEKWFWEKGKEALLKIESPTALMLIAWCARSELKEEIKP